MQNYQIVKTGRVQTKIHEIKNQKSMKSKIASLKIASLKIALVSKFDFCQKMCYNIIRKKSANSRAKGDPMNLNFELETAEQRALYIKSYLETKHNLSASDLETIANYILWGTKSRKEFDLRGKHRTWNREPNESLDAILETSDNDFQPLSLARVDKFERKNFDRQEARDHCPDYVRAAFEDLWRAIDELDYAIGCYDLAHNRRTKPIRSSLRERLSPEQQKAASAQAASWSSYIYLKMRHRLVEMRREQYTLRDSFATPIQSIPSTTGVPAPSLTYEVLPLGVAPGAIFRPWSELRPDAFSETELRAISDLVWAKKKSPPTGNQFWIDFREPEHVY